ncbi:hypothetical protein FQN57_005485 [Myotisia sp. PD_48]|nr:hypothetical protein FQN57_005485 [Myotisia sp. PD_48]
MVNLKAAVAGIAVLVSLTDAAELLGFTGKKNIIPNAYIVVMKEDLSEADFTSHMSWVANVHSANAAASGVAGIDGVKFVYNVDNFKGYSGKFDDNTLNELVMNENVLYIEPDRLSKIAAVKRDNLAWVTQKNAVWGLGRISHKTGSSRDYIYDDTAAEGIMIYSIDTGVDIKHPDFEGRAAWGINTVDRDDTDGHGHGTHTSSTIMGKTYGVAKKAKLLAAKVYDARGVGPDSATIKAIDWAVNHAKQNNHTGKAAMNLSLVSDGPRALNAVSTKAVEAGIFLAAAAGNDGRTVTTESPASADKVCTVGATSQGDGKASFSNYGRFLALFAPGDGIMAAIPNGRYTSYSGTSMASPHVCGVGAALMVQEGIAPGQAVYASLDKHLEDREALISYEKRLRSDDGFRRSLSHIAEQACEIVQRIRAEEQTTIWKKPWNEPEDGVELYPGMMFSLAKNRMEATKLWEITQKMPKGALLHSHLSAMVDVEWLLNECIGVRGLHIFASEPLTSPAALKNATVLFGVSEVRHYADRFPSIWSSGYQCLTYVSASLAANTFPDGGRQGFIAWLVSRCCISEKESLEHHLGVDAIWRTMAAAFPILGSLLAYEPIYRIFLQKLFRTLIDDGVQWVEIRDVFQGGYLREGQNYQWDHDYLNKVKAFGEEVEKFKATPYGSKFWGARLIWTALRGGPSEDIVESMEQCIKAKKAYPDIIAGFDLVGQEDLGKTHKELGAEIIWFRELCDNEGLEIPFFFHAGECLGDGDATDQNLFDAILFGTRRLGHGFSLYKHPELIEIVKQKRILVESCPISNEVLRLTATVLAHPLPSLLARGVPASLSNDDPALLGQGTSGMSHDFWEALQAWDNLGLAGLGSLAENSVRWAAYEDQSEHKWRVDIDDGYRGEGIRAKRMKEWRESWESFCQWIVDEFGSPD